MHQALESLGVLWVPSCVPECVAKLGGGFVPSSSRTGRRSRQQAARLSLYVPRVPVRARPLATRGTAGGCMSPLGPNSTVPNPTQPHTQKQQELHASKHADDDGLLLGPTHPPAAPPPTSTLGAARRHQPPHDPRLCALAATHDDAHVPTSEHPAGVRQAQASGSPSARGPRPGREGNTLLAACTG